MDAARTATSWTPAAMKRLYRTRLLAIRVDTMSAAEQLREQGKARKMKAGTMGLAEGHQPHVLNAAEILCEAWDHVHPEAIVRCWVKARTLPAPM